MVRPIFPRTLLIARCRVKRGKVLPLLAILSILVSSFLVFFSICVAPVEAGNDKYLPGEVIVGARGFQLDELSMVVEGEGGVVKKRLDQIAALLVKVPERTVSSFIDAMKKYPLVRCVERNYRGRSLCLTPNDPYWSEQWGPKKIQADFAWNLTTGSDTILVAIIDTGLDYTHDDLTSNYQAGGWDYVDDDGDPMDQHGLMGGHGTHAGGIVAAVLNNQVGIAGIAQVRIMAERIFDEGGTYVGDFDAAAAIIDATNKGVKILSCSWGGYTYSQVLHDAFIYAYNNGAISLAASGNDNTNRPFYPASFEEVISVTATSQDDRKASFSNYGNTIELAAPGVNILSTFLDDTYAYMSGTSMAVPHASGVAALAWSRHPEFTNSELRNLLDASADDLGSQGWDQYFGYGRINALKAVLAEDYDITVQTSGLLSPSYTTHVYVDEVDQGEPYLWDGAPRLFSLEAGPSHVVMVDKYVYGEPGVRYYCSSCTKSVFTPSQLTFKYVTQYSCSFVTSGLREGTSVIIIVNKKAYSGTAPYSYTEWFYSGTWVTVRIMATSRTGMSPIFLYWRDEAGRIVSRFPFLRYYVRTTKIFYAVFM